MIRCRRLLVVGGGKGNGGGGIVGTGGRRGSHRGKEQATGDRADRKERYRALGAVICQLSSTGTLARHRIERTIIYGIRLNMFNAAVLRRFGCFE